MTNGMLLTAAAASLSTLLAFGSPQGAFADGRGDWNGYAWQKVDASTCQESGGVATCPAYHQKWDWKRNQWVDITVAFNATAGTLTLGQVLTNKDPRDHDFVCVTALLVDAAGRNIVAHHTNWSMDGASVKQESFSYTRKRLEEAATFYIGSKQCRDGEHEDDDTYALVLSRLGS